jgi:hypothetical protein
MFTATAALIACIVATLFRRKGAAVMAAINETSLAVDVSRREGGVRNQPIAQIAETIKHTLDCLAIYSDDQILALVQKHRDELAKPKRGGGNGNGGRKPTA